MGIILTPFAWLLLRFYDLCGYGLALILFAIVVKTILFPVTLKGKKSMIQTTMLSGKMQQLQKQYGKDRERYNMEVQKLYEREKVNPMGGCLWSLIPIALLMVLYFIIREPLTYFMGLSAEQIATVAEITGIANEGAYPQIAMASALSNPETLAAVQAALGEAGSGVFAMNFSFLGIDLSAIPNWQFWKGGLGWDTVGLFLLPIFSTAVSVLSMKVSMATNKVNQQTRNEQMDRTNKVMMYTMPLMTVWIGFTVPAGLSIYWVAQYFVTILQEIICSRMLKKDYEAARKAAEERERQEKEEEKRRKEEARLERQRRLEEEKKNRGKKKPGQKKNSEEPDQEGVNKNDSREGIRAYARGRAYIPDRFGGVTPYHDPNELVWTRLEQAEAKRKGKAKEESQEDFRATTLEKAPEETAPASAEPQALESAPAETAAPAEEAAGQTPAAPETEAGETEEVEIEVEQVEVEADDEDDHKEGV